MQLKLYLASPEPEHHQLARNLRSALERVMSHEFTLQVLDVLSNTQQAIEDDIFVTPTLLRRSPGPELRIIGRFDDPAPILALLGAGPP